VTVNIFISVKIVKVRKKGQKNKRHEKIPMYKKRIKDACTCSIQQQEKCAHTTVIKERTTTTKLMTIK
jgi:hypothetical protein